MNMLCELSLKWILFHIFLLKELTGRQLQMAFSLGELTVSNFKFLMSTDMLFYSESALSPLKMELQVNDSPI